MEKGQMDDIVDPVDTESVNNPTYSPATEIAGLCKDLALVSKSSPSPRNSPVAEVETLKDVSEDDLTTDLLLSPKHREDFTHAIVDKDMALENASEKDSDSDSIAEAVRDAVDCLENQVEASEQADAVQIPHDSTKILVEEEVGQSYSIVPEDDGVPKEKEGQDELEPGEIVSPPTSPISSTPSDYSVDMADVEEEEEDNFDMQTSPDKMDVDEELDEDDNEEVATISTTPIVNGVGAGQVEDESKLAMMMDTCVDDHTDLITLPLEIPPSETEVAVESESEEHSDSINEAVRDTVAFLEDQVEAQEDDEVSSHSPLVEREQTPERKTEICEEVKSGVRDSQSLRRTGRLVERMDESEGEEDDDEDRLYVDESYVTPSLESVERERETDEVEGKLTSKQVVSNSPEPTCEDILIEEKEVARKEETTKEHEMPVPTAVPTQLPQSSHIPPPLAMKFEAATSPMSPAATGMPDYVPSQVKFMLPEGYPVPTTKQEQHYVLLPTVTSTPSQQLTYDPSSLYFIQSDGQQALEGNYQLVYAVATARADPNDGAVDGPPTKVRLVHAEALGIGHNGNDLQFYYASTTPGQRVQRTNPKVQLNNPVRVTHNQETSEATSEMLRYKVQPAQPSPQVLNLSTQQQQYQLPNVQTYYQRTIAGHVDEQNGRSPSQSAENMGNVTVPSVKQESYDGVCGSQDLPGRYLEHRVQVKSNQSSVVASVYSDDPERHAWMDKARDVRQMFPQGALQYSNNIFRGQRSTASSTVASSNMTYGRPQCHSSSQVNHSSSSGGDVGNRKPMSGLDLLTSLASERLAAMQYERLCTERAAFAMMQMRDMVRRQRLEQAPPHNHHIQLPQQPLHQQAPRQRRRRRPGAEDDNSCPQRYHA